MADYGPSKSKSFRSSKEERMKPKQRERHEKDHNVEPKTPPLPPRRRSSIEELMKQRETLKKQLMKFSKKSSESDFKSEYKSNKPEKSRRHSKSDYTYESRKRSSNYEEYRTKKSNIVQEPLSEHNGGRKPSSGKHEEKRTKKNIGNELSPERNGGYVQIESEDEESIIEMRRKQRKKLLEKFNVPQEKKCESNLNKHTIISRSNTTTDPKNTTEMSSFLNNATDMFSDNSDFPPKSVPDHVKQDNAETNALHLTDNWDDSEGYYNIKVGDVINNNRYTIKSILGKGVFANVVRAQDGIKGNMDVAIKIVRNNELMYKTSLKEVAYLKEIGAADPENKYHCVKMFTHFMHKGHHCLVLEAMCMDLRTVIKKYGKHHGINMKALASYSRQLLVALRLLEKIGVVHADIKPDNILVNEKKNVLKLCDFGSATKVDENEPTPYLVSRFYRAPEIILGIHFKHGVDIWSAACTMFEMATGKIMFAGSSNNKMLKCFMDLKGKFSTKLIRKGKFKNQHFNYNNNFLLHKKDEFTGREKLVEVGNITISRDLQKELKKFSKTSTAEEDKKLMQLKDMLDKMLMLDASQRLVVNDCLRHPFIQEELRK